MAFHIAIAIVLVALIIVGTLYFLDFYTNHGESFSVPDFEGLSLTEVESLCSEKHLRFEIIDSVYSTKAERGAVVDQSPGKDFKVKENRTIFLTINAFYPERVKMPKIEGVSLRQATALLETYGLKVGKLEYRPYEYQNFVLGQKFNGREIKENDLIEKGSSIDLIVGRGTSNEKTIVPNLIGLTFAQANEKLTDAMLNVRVYEADEELETLEDSLAAFVWKQSPRHHKKAEISLGAFVDVWLTSNEDLVPGADSTMIDTVSVNE